MSNSQKQKLINLGANQLADTLLDLATHSEITKRTVARLISPPKKNLQSFKKNLSALKESQTYYGWGKTDPLSDQLMQLLDDLEAGATDPLDGLEMLSEFYQVDSYVMELCDDSFGEIGSIFQFSAKELFSHYAALCPDKEKVVSIMLELNLDDDYGMRDTLFEKVSKFLPKKIIRQTIDKLQKLADNEEGEFGKSQYFNLIETLARQIKDANLFEKTRTASCEELSSAAY